MRKTYQGMESNSKQKFEVLGNQELLVEVPLPMLEGGRSCTPKSSS